MVRDGPYIQPEKSDPNMEHDFNDAALRGMLNEKVNLLEQLRILELALAERRRFVVGGKAPSTDKQVERGRYEGMKLKNALHNYLAERGGGPISLAKAGADLLVGGINYGPSKRSPEHHLSVMAASGKNRDIFVVDKETKTVSLLEGQ
jgi:hypothetical protein